MVQEFVFSEKLMGCDFDVSLICTHAQQARDVYTSILAHGRAYEERFSRFLATSELSQLNRAQKRCVSETFWHVFHVGHTLHKQTGGVFNPLVQIARFGYDTSFDHLSTTPHKSQSASYSTSYDNLSTDPVRREITLHASQTLDFGGFLKGLVAQEMAEMAAHLPGVIVNIGGDLATRGVDAQGQHFLFDLYNPYTQEEIPGIPLHNQSLATSGIYKRVWHRAEKKTHHILRADGTDNPPTDLLSASIIADDGALSDALATTAIILGSRDAKHALTQHGVQYILITQHGTIHTNLHHLI